MQQTLLLFPMFAMVLLTFLVGGWLLNCRIQSVRQGLVSRSYFKLNQSDRAAPEKMVQAAQHYANLFEMPVLFYACILLAYTAEWADWTLLTLAWAYVVCRFVHTAIHLGSNKVMWRMWTFLLSFALLLLMWMWVFIKAVSA